MKKDNYYDRACALHQENPIVDTHLDLAAEVYLRHLMGEKNVIKNRYLEDFRKAGVNLIVSSIFVENNELPYRGLEMTLNQIAALYQDVDSVSQYVSIVKNADDIKRVVDENKIGIMIYMEGLDIITSSPDILRALYEMGVRGASLTWSRRNFLAEGCCTASKRVQIPGGLSKLGKDTLHKLEELHMFVDVSHLNDDGYAELVQETQKPFIASHSNARGVYMNYRNMTDEQIRILGERGGIMGMNACSCIVGARPGQEGIEKICDHIQYIGKLIGYTHVGIGMDLCDRYYEAGFHQGYDRPQKPDDVIHDHGELPFITAELLRRGVPETDIINIIGSNYIRYFTQILL